MIVAPITLARHFDQFVAHLATFAVNADPTSASFITSASVGHASLVA